MAALLALGRVIPIWAWVLALALGWGAWQRHQVRAMAAQQAHEAQRTAERTLSIERANTASLETIANDTHTQMRRARADAAAARDAVAGLQLAAQAAAAAGCTAAPAAAASSAAGGAGVVLADVLGGAAGRAAELAAALDQAHAAGTACERAYDAVRRPPGEGG